MERFACHSQLKIGSQAADQPGYRKITILLNHQNHKPYYDVTMPPEAIALIRENLEWTTPVSMVAQIQALYPNVTPSQIHRAWTDMSETLWKREKDQLSSAKTLLNGYKDDVDVFDIDVQDGLQQLCWGMKKILTELKGKVVEIAVDATCKLPFHCLAHLLTCCQDNTNQKHLELYSILGEYDNSGFPPAYCLLSTAESLEIGKRTKALTAWATALRDKYGIYPVFVHVDKDMAEIGMSRFVWINGKIQLCWWHLRKAARERLAKGKLSTTPYDARQAQSEFPFINITFTPKGGGDATEYEGGARDMTEVKDKPLTRINSFHHEINREMIKPYLALNYISLL
jgi:hypothetical protein